MSATRTPADLAFAILRSLPRNSKKPPLKSITRLLETMFESSLKTEEGQSIKFNITYIDPRNPDPMPPKRIVRDRWISVPFSSPFPFTVERAVKLAKATDPRSSSIAVYHTASGSIEAWGLIDQNLQAHKFANYDAESGSPRPGLFQAEISGLGHLIALREFKPIAELQVSTIAKKPPDIMYEGPIAQTLNAIAGKLTSSIPTTHPHLDPENTEIHSQSINGHLKTTLYRILSRIRDHRHGGAIIFTPDKNLEHLKVKFKTNYTRLGRAIQSIAVSETVKWETEQAIYSEYLEQDSETIPAEFYTTQAISSYEIEESTSEIEGIIWFISLLSRVDGAVVIGDDLSVQGFGAEIVCNKEPADFFKTTTRTASSRSLRKFDPQQFGTRHRSMFRYCYA
ncbi:MAG: hypothetical protein EOP84_17410, partial [Verrucomicrobiaceae bacterium]